MQFVAVSFRNFPREKDLPWKASHDFGSQGCRFEPCRVQWLITNDLCNKCVESHSKIYAVIMQFPGFSRLPTTACTLFEPFKTDALAFDSRRFDDASAIIPLGVFRAARDRNDDEQHVDLR